MKPIVLRKIMKPTVEPTWCALCCCSILGGDNVFVLKTGFGTECDILCSAECARIAAESTVIHGFTNLTPEEASAAEKEGLFTAFELKHIKKTLPVQEVPPCVC